jgi:hypothetical protein
MTKKTQENSTPVTGLALMRVAFAANQIKQVPRGGGVQLDYVGHAALTDRLLDVDPAWQWEPVAFSTDGLPKLDAIGGLWIRLTVCGVTRLGYGHAGAKQGGDAVKELIGDALRNAAMRFGAALELWHKDHNLHTPGTPAQSGPPPPPARYEAFKARMIDEAAKGLPALQKFFARKDVASYRTYCTAHDLEWWTTLSTATQARAQRPTGPTPVVTAPSTTSST